MRSSLLEQNSGKFWQERPTIVSNEFATTGTLTEAGSTQLVLGHVSIPKGAYVTKVALLCTAAIGTQLLDVGDSDRDNRYLGAIVSASVDDIIVAPHVVGSRVGGGFVGGRYYDTADTIQVTSNATNATADKVGSAKLLVWYFV